MIEQEFLLLGLLKEKPAHGYEIKKNIKDIVSYFAGIDVKSIYYPLKILEKKGLVSKTSVKSGKRPKRYVYNLTVKGRERFEELLGESFFNLKRPQFSLDLSLYFLQFLKPGALKRKLRARALILGRISNNLSRFIDSSKNKKPPYIISILEHNLGMLKAESRFLNELTETLKD